MPSQKGVLAQSPTRSYEKELQDLYARRSMIRSLIERLEEYERLRGKRLSPAKKSV